MKLLKVIKPIWVYACVLLIAANGAVAASMNAEQGEEYANTIIERIHSIYPKLVIDDVKRSEIPNIAEVYAGGKIIYFSPDKNILVFGELYDASGASLTQKKIGEYTAKKLAALDKTDALTYGTGPDEVVAFVNPYCVYCKKAYDWFSAEKLPGVKQYVYLVPSPGSADAKERAIEVLCASEAGREKALLDSFDRNHVVATSTCADVEQRLEVQQRTAAALGISATPTFVVNGTVIEGFSPEKIKAALKPNKGS